MHSQHRAAVPPTARHLHLKPLLLQASCQQHQTALRLHLEAPPMLCHHQKDRPQVSFHRPIAGFLPSILLHHPLQPRLIRLHPQVSASQLHQPRLQPVRIFCAFRCILTHLTHLSLLVGPHQQVEAIYPPQPRRSPAIIYSVYISPSIHPSRPALIPLPYRHCHHRSPNPTLDPTSHGFHLPNCHL